MRNGVLTGKTQVLYFEECVSNIDLGSASINRFLLEFQVGRLRGIEYVPLITAVVPHTIR